VTIAKKVHLDCMLIMWEVAQRVSALVEAPSVAKQVSRGVTCAYYQTEFYGCIMKWITIRCQILVR